MFVLSNSIAWVEVGGDFNTVLKLMLIHVCMLNDR